MADDLTFGVAIKGTGDGGVVKDAKAARDGLVDLKKATDDLAASSSKLNASAKEDFAALQQSMNASAAAWQKEQAATDAAADRSFALANGYKEVDGQLLKVAKSTGEATHMNAGMSRELMVIGHEAMTGNFSRIPGSLAVLANRSGLAASGMLGLGLAVAAPLVALGALAVAAHEGGQEIDEMNRSLSLTSGYSGQSVDSLFALAHTLSDTTQLTIGQSKNLATQLAASGKIGADSFDSVAMAITAYTRVSGEDIDKVTPKMIKLFSDPAKGAVELNSTMHFLNATQLQQIDILQRTGHLTEAQTVLSGALTTQLEKQKENVGYLAGAWHGLGKAASSAWDSLMGIGREDTLDEKIKAAKELLMSAAQGGNMEAVQRRQLELAELLKQKTKEVAEVNTTAAATKKRTDENEIINLAKQNSELWKKYETSLKLAQITGAAAPNAPSMSAIKADATSQLNGSAKLLAEVKKFDEQALESHKDAMMKWVDLWVKGQNDLVEKGAYGTAARERHEAAYTQYITEEMNKRKAAEDATNNKTIQAQQEKFTRMQEQANQASLTGEQRENIRYAAQLRTLERDKKVLDDKHLWDLQSEAKYLAAKEALEKEHKAKMSQMSRTYGTTLLEFEDMTATRRTQTMASGLEQMTAVGAQKHRALFEINKIASMANATISGIQAVQDSYKFGASWGGPAGGAAMAGIALVATLANIEAIRDTEFGGGAPNVGGGGVPSLSTSPGVPVAPQPTPGNPSNGTGGLIVNIYNTGNVLSADYVENTIIPQIRDNISNSDVLLIDPRSRQAQILVKA